MKLNPSIKNMSNEYIFFTDQTALTFRICLVLERMVVVYGESAPSYYKVKFWSKQFKWGRESIKDDPHTGHPVEATSEEMCQKMESLDHYSRKAGHVQGQCKMGLKNAESFSEGHWSPVLSRELEAAH